MKFKSLSVVLLLSLIPWAAQARSRFTAEDQDQDEYSSYSGRRSVSSKSPRARTEADSEAEDEVEGKPRTMAVGIQGGVNFSNVLTQYSSYPANNYTNYGYYYNPYAMGSYPTTTARTRMMLGATFEYKVYSILYVQPEVNYVQRGFNMSMNTYYGYENITVDNDYIEVPLFLKGKVGNGALRAFFLAGPEVDFLINKNVAAQTNYTYFNFANNDLSNNFNTTVFGAAGGGGVEFDIGKSATLVLSLKYYYGFTNALHYPSSGLRQLNYNGVQGMTGVQFPF